MVRSIAVTNLGFWIIRFNLRFRNYLLPFITIVNASAAIKISGLIDKDRLWSVHTLESVTVRGLLNIEFYCILKSLRV
jgi:hypothetical protein